MSRAISFIGYFRFSCGMLLLCPLVHAQGEDLRLRPGSFEVGMLVGDTLGGLVPAQVTLPDFHGFEVKSPGRGAVGVGVGLAASSKLLFYGEVSVFKGEKLQRDLSGGYSADTNLLNLIYEGGFQRIFPIVSEFIPADTKRLGSAADTKKLRLAGYILGGGSAIQKRVDTVVNFVDPNPQPAPTEVFGGATRVRLRKSGFAPLFGTGLRYYFGRFFVFRLETKLYLPTSDVPRPTGVASIGLFVDIP